MYYVEIFKCWLIRIWFNLKIKLWNFKWFYLRINSIIIIISVRIASKKIIGCIQNKAIKLNNLNPILKSWLDIFW